MNKIELFKLFGTIAVDNSEALKALDETSAKGQQTQSKMSKFFSGLGRGAAVAGKVVGGAMLAGGTAIVGLTSKALSATGELEQNLGGSEAVFGQYADKLQEKAKSAFSSMGLSTSDYLATANKMGSLFKGAGFETSEAMDLTTKAMQRASDVASIMGIDSASAMESIAGAAKGNFTMMDNLGVAMNDTTLQAYALEKGIKKSTQEMTNQEKIGLAMEMFLEKTADYAGNYTKENETLAGSLGTAKAALKNFLDGSGDVDSLVKTFAGAANSIVGQITKLAPRLVSGLTDIVNQLLPMIPPLLDQLLPVIVESATGLVNNLTALLPSVLDAILGMLPGLIAGIEAIFNGMVEALPGLIEAISAALPTLLPLLIDAIVSMIVTLCSQFASIIQPIIDHLPDIIVSIVNALVDNLPALIDGIILLVLGIVAAIPQIIKGLVDATPTVIAKIVEGLLRAVPQLIKGLIQVIGGVVKALPQIFSSLVTGFKNTFIGIWNGIKNVFSGTGGFFKEKFTQGKKNVESAWSTVKNFFKNIWSGIKNVFSSVGGWFKDKFNSAKSGVQNAWSGVKNFFSNVKNGIVNAFSNVKEKLSAPFEKARDKIKGVVDKIKGFFSNLKFKWPKLKMPKFSISPAGWKIGDLLKGVKPKLGITWAKEGGIFDDPTLFNTPSGLLGVGEAGAEAVAPIDKLTGYVESAVKAETNGITELLERIIELLTMFFPQMLEAATKDGKLDINRLAAMLAPAMNTKLNEIKVINARGG